MSDIYSLLNRNSPSVMGILNATPDSFSDGGRFIQKDAAQRQIEAMLKAGVDIIDIGGESTRPGAAEVSLQEELDRVLPLLEICRSLSDSPVSIDTSKPQVMTEALSKGANMINDVRALQEQGALDAVAKFDCPVCLMHMQGQPRTMQKNPSYQDVVKEVIEFFKSRINECQFTGIEKERIILDPGFGFGKTVQHNYELLHQLPDLVGLGYPVLAGVSRKSMLGAVTGKPVNERLAASISAAVIAVNKGAKIIRVHDVSETVDAIKIVNAVNAFNEVNVES